MTPRTIVFKSRRARMPPNSNEGNASAARNRRVWVRFLLQQRRNAMSILLRDLRNQVVVDSDEHAVPGLRAAHALDWADAPA
jgi:hypothetical protein